VRHNISIVLALLICGCTDNVRDLRLAQVDLTNIATVREMGDSLSPPERAALLTYAAIHAPSSTGFCGKKLQDGFGQEPETIGDAIDLTLRRAAQSSVSASL
jgi:hypothetical protein